MHRIIKYFLVFFIYVFPINWVHSQPGYMGKMNLASISTEIHPNFTKFNDKITFIAADITLSYERVINRKFSLAVEYTKQYFRLPTKGQPTGFRMSGNLFIQSELMNDINLSANHFTVNLNKFRSSGGIAPFGKYFSYQIGIVRVGINDQSLYKSNHYDGDYFYEAYEVELKNTNLTLYHFGFGMMNRRAIGEKLILKYGIGFNLFVNPKGFLEQKVNTIGGNFRAGFTRNGFQNRVNLNDQNEIPSDSQLSKTYTNYVVEGANYRVSSLGFVNFKFAIEFPF